VEDRLRAATARTFPARDALEAGGRTGRIIAFVGPTGSGKTTTAAKVAALARSRGFQKVALVTTDLNRPGTVSHSRALGRSVGAHVGAARGRSGLAKALRYFGSSDLIVVDTAGESPFDESHYDRLRELLHQEEPVGIHVVLPASGDSRCNRSALDRYVSLGPQGLVFTKLDENRVCGPLFSEVGRTGLPVSFVCGGPHVPEDLEVPTASRVRDMILRRVIWRNDVCSLEKSRSPQSPTEMSNISGASECA
jgi:flagellar biosynthesis protein FlhF